jgi:transporter family-2 protein
MVVFYLILAVLAGGMLPSQAATNARLSDSLGGPVWAAALSGLVLTIVLTLVASTASRGGPRLDGLGALPWWAWIGGFCGVVLLSVSTALTPLLGAEQMIALVMTGQVLASIALDNFRPCRPGAATLEPQTRNRRKIANNRSGSDAVKRNSRCVYARRFLD